MSKFYVGQRVRIVRNAFSNIYPGYNRTVGTETKIIGISSEPDAYVLELTGDRGCVLCALGSELMPLYDGDQKSEFSFTEIMDKLKTNELEALA